jgi:hypothetical protein
MKRKLVSKSAFFNPRFLTGFVFCSIGLFLALLAFARPNKPVEQQNKSLAQQSIPTFVGVALPVPKHKSAPVVSIRPMEIDGVIDMAALDIHPATAPLPLRALSRGGSSPEGAAMGTGKAFLGVTHDVVNANTDNALGRSAPAGPRERPCRSISMEFLRQRLSPIQTASLRSR